MVLEVLIDGMTCGGCEQSIEKVISGIAGVEKVNANHLTRKVVIKISDSIDEINLLLDVEQKILETNYKYLGKYKKKHESFSVKQWVGIVIILAALYLVVKETGILSRLPVIDNSMGYGLIFIIGLLTSVHCIGMCGGINLSVSITGLNKKHKQTSALLYNAGRVVSYTIIGGIVGALGSVISITGVIQGVIVGIAGIFMVLMGIKMLGFLPIIDKIIPKLPKSLTSKIVGSGTGKGPFIIGVLNGFMPCGPLQSVQIYALGTGSALSGALSMFLFSLGTIPLMLGFGTISSILPSKFQSRIIKVSALLVLMLGTGMVLRGMNLNGITLPGTGNLTLQSENVRIAEIKDDKQYVTTKMHGSEYEPFIVQAGIPVVWTIIAEEADLNGCNNPLTVPEYGIRFTMKPGENIINFTPPSKKATIKYTCWMGMITSGITVVEDLSSVDLELISETASLSKESEGGCSSGGLGDGCCSADPSPLEQNSTNLPELNLPKIGTDSIGIASIEDGKQKVEVVVNENGFEPAIIVMQKGIEISWIINGQELNEDNYRLNFPIYGNRGVELRDGENILKLVPEIDFQYYSWKKDFAGFVKVIEDINNVNEQYILDEVQSLNRQNGNK